MEYGVRYEKEERNGRTVGHEKFFVSDKARQMWVAAHPGVTVTAYCDPRAESATA